MCLLVFLHPISATDAAVSCSAQLHRNIVKDNEDTAARMKRPSITNLSIIPQTFPHPLQHLMRSLSWVLCERSTKCIVKCAVLLLFIELPEEAKVFLFMYQFILNTVILIHYKIQKLKNLLCVFLRHK